MATRRTKKDKDKKKKILLIGALAVGAYFMFSGSASAQTQAPGPTIGPGSRVHASQLPPLAKATVAMYKATNNEIIKKSLLPTIKSQGFMPADAAWEYFTVI